MNELFTISLELKITDKPTKKGFLGKYTQILPDIKLNIIPESSQHDISTLACFLSRRYVELVVDNLKRDVGMIYPNSEIKYTIIRNVVSHSQLSNGGNWKYENA